MKSSKPSVFMHRHDEYLSNMILQLSVMKSSYYTGSDTWSKLDRLEKEAETLYVESVKSKQGLMKTQA